MSAKYLNIFISLMKCDSFGGAVGNVCPVGVFGGGCGHVTAERVDVHLNLAYQSLIKKQNDA